MAQEQHPAMTRLVAVHLVLALAPALTGFISVEMKSLPMVWSLASVPLAQLMLVAIWAGLGARCTIFWRVIILLAVGAYLAIGSSLGQGLMLEQPTVSAFVAAYMANVSIFWVLLALLSLVLAGLERVIGQIKQVDLSDLTVREPRYQFSLIAMLAASTVIGLALSLSRLSWMQRGVQPGRTTAVEYALAVVIFSLNVFVMVWATLGPAHVKRRLVIVFGTAFLLGVLFAIGAGNSLEMQPWWFVLSLTLVVLVPTAIAVVSLLYLRRHGYRLIPPGS